MQLHNYKMLLQFDEKCKIIIKNIKKTDNVFELVQFLG